MCVIWDSQLRLEQVHFQPSIPWCGPARVGFIPYVARKLTKEWNRPLAALEEHHVSIKMLSCILFTKYSNSSCSHPGPNQALNHDLLCIVQRKFVMGNQFLYLGVSKEDENLPGLLRVCRCWCWCFFSKKNWWIAPRRPRSWAKFITYNDPIKTQEKPWPDLWSEVHHGWSALRKDRGESYLSLQTCTPWTLQFWKRRIIIHSRGLAVIHATWNITCCRVCPPSRNLESPPFPAVCCPVVVGRIKNLINPVLKLTRCLSHEGGEIAHELIKSRRPWSTGLDLRDNERVSGKDFHGVPRHEICWKS